MAWGVVTALPLLEGQEAGWKRLVQFALIGSSDLEPYAILLVRVSLGLFFAISGANKLFVAGNAQTMYETLVEAKVPYPHLMTYFVSGVEFVGGSLLTVGFLSSLACVALLVNMLVAILTTRLFAMPKGLSPLNWLDDFLYLAEVRYVLFFIWLNCSGPGKVQSRLLARRQVTEVIDLIFENQESLGEALFQSAQRVVVLANFGCGCIASDHRFRFMQITCARNP